MFKVGDQVVSVARDDTEGKTGVVSAVFEDNDGVLLDEDEGVIKLPLYFQFFELRKVEA